MWHKIKGNDPELSVCHELLSLSAHRELLSFIQQYIDNMLAKIKFKGRKVIKINNNFKI